MSLSLSVEARRGDFDVDVAFASDRRALVIEGPSGAGKTTLLYALAGLIPSGRAELSIDGVSLLPAVSGRPAPRGRRIGFVFQDMRLFPHMTVEANIGFGRRYAPDSMPVAEAMELLDLRGLERRWPAGLSGGEARRVAIARALCSDPAMLFLDEPFAGLDAGRRADLLPYLIRLRDEVGLPMLLVSHDPRDGEALALDGFRMEGGRLALR